MTLASKLQRHRRVFAERSTSPLSAPKATTEGKGYSPLSPPLSPALEMSSLTLPTVSSFSFEPLKPAEEPFFPAVRAQEKTPGREFSLAEELAFTKREFPQTMEEE